MGCWESNSNQLLARQAPYLLCCLCSPCLGTFLMDPGWLPHGGARKVVRRLVQKGEGGGHKDHYIESLQVGVLV